MKKYKISLFKGTARIKDLKTGLSYDEATKVHSELSQSVKLDKKKEFLKIEEDDDDYSLELTGSENIEMAPGEATIVKKLFEKNTAYDLMANLPMMKKFFEVLGGVPIETDDSGKVTKIKLTQKNHQRIGGALSAHKLTLKNNYDKIYFLTNRAYFVIGFVITLVVLVATISSHPSSMSPDPLMRQRPPSAS